MGAGLNVLIGVLSNFGVYNIKKGNYHYESVVKTKKENSESIFWGTVSEFTWKSYNNSARISAISSKDILNQLKDLGVNINFLLPPGECMPSNLFHHHSPAMSEQPNPTSHPAHTRDFQDRLKHSFVHRLLKLQLSKDSGVITVTRIWAGNLGFDFSQG